MELNKNENTTQQNLWDIVKAVIWEKFINLSAYIKKIRKSWTKKLDKQKQIKFKPRWQQEIIRTWNQWNRNKETMALRAGSLRR